MRGLIEPSHPNYPFLGELHYGGRNIHPIAEFNLDELQTRHGVFRRMLKVGYRIFLRKNSGGVSIADDSDVFDVKVGATEERAGGFEIGGTEKDDFQYIESDPPEDQILVTYQYDTEDVLEKPDSDGNLKVRKATVKAVSNLLPHIEEKMTYDTLYRVSEPRRKIRAQTVRGPALEIDPDKLSEYYWFNFKSYPSTTGLRHRGYARFFKPRGILTADDKRPIEKVPCLVDCSCPDYRYRWAWANKQRGSGVVGTASLNQAHNRAPRKTNPSGAPGLCKHLLAMKDYVYGITSSFQNSDQVEPRKFKQNLDYATKRWINFPGEMAKARERDKMFRQARQARTDGTLPDPIKPEAFPEPDPLPVDDPESEKVAQRLAPKEPHSPQDAVIPDPPKIGEEPEDIVFSKQPSFLQRVGAQIRKLFSSEKKAKPEEKKTPTQESVSNVSHMKTNYSSLVSLVEELQTEIPASNPGEEAIGLLTQMKDLLTTLVDLNTPEAEGGEEGEDDAGDPPAIDDIGDEEDGMPDETADETTPEPGKAPPRPAHLR